MSLMKDLKPVFGDLGKATRRGVRKCPKCFTINGTRGLSCKNSLCDVVFKKNYEIPDHHQSSTTKTTSSKIKSVNLEACKLITDQGNSSWTTSTFSIRLRPTNCPDHLRGFVQITYDDLNRDVVSDHDNSTNPILFPILTPIKGTCFVTGCKNSGLAVKISQEDACIHVLACLNPTEAVESEPFTLKHSVLNSMSISSEWKHTIWLKARRDGPLVQRVAPFTMAVKCEKDENHPLGYLHTSFLSASNNSTETGYRFSCTCALVSRKKNMSILSLNTPEVHPSNSPDVKWRCVHFYSCIAAFSSDPALAKEFARFISDDSLVSSMQQVIAILGEDGSDITVEVSGEENLDLSLNSNLEFLESEEGHHHAHHNISHLPAINADELLVGSANLSPVKTRETRTDQNPNETESTSAQNFQTPTVYHHQDANVVSVLAPNIENGSALGVAALSAQAQPVLSFNDWLSSITETINYTQHYGHSGSGDLNTTIPHHFFDFLMERISAGSKKKRLPNSTQSIERNQPPRGKFTKYTWMLTNVLQVKQVFDTTLITLEVSRKFSKSEVDGSYHYEKPSPIEPGRSSLINHGGILPKKPKIGKLIRPLEYKTFLKVGQMSSDPRDVTPFVIEWIPDLLPRCKMGELRIKFEYGHQRNGQVDQTKLK